MRQQWFTHVRLLVAHLTRSRRAFFPERSPPRLLTDAASGGLGSPPVRRARRAKPSSLAQHRLCWRPSTSPSRSFHGHTTRTDALVRRLFGNFLEDAGISGRHARWKRGLWCRLGVRRDWRPREWLRRTTPVTPRSLSASMNRNTAGTGARCPRSTAMLPRHNPGTEPDHIVTVAHMRDVFRVEGANSSSGSRRRGDKPCSWEYRKNVDNVCRLSTSP